MKEERYRLDWPDTRRVGGYSSQSYFEEHKQKIEVIKKNLLSLSYGRIIRKSIDSSFGLYQNHLIRIILFKEEILFYVWLIYKMIKKSSCWTCEKMVAYYFGILNIAFKKLVESNDSLMYYLCIHMIFVKSFYNFGGGVRQGGTWSDIYKMELLIPPCNEQQNCWFSRQEKLPSW